MSSHTYQMTYHLSPITPIQHFPLHCSLGFGGGAGCAPPSSKSYSCYSRLQQIVSYCKPSERSCKVPALLASLTELCLSNCQIWPAPWKLVQSQAFASSKAFLSRKTNLLMLKVRLHLIQSVHDQKVVI